MASRGPVRGRPPVDDRLVPRASRLVGPEEGARRRSDRRDGVAAGRAMTTEIRGVVLAGGFGRRLYPLTRITNKHLLPVYDRPMIHYAIEALVGAHIERIMVVTGGNHAGEFLPLLGNGSDFGLRHLDYTYQEKAGGIAEALGLAEHFAAGARVCVMLADNIFERSI